MWEIGQRQFSAVGFGNKTDSHRLADRKFWKIWKLEKFRNFRTSYIQVGLGKRKCGIYRDPDNPKPTQIMFYTFKGLRAKNTK